MTFALLKCCILCYKPQPSRPVQVLVGWPSSCGSNHEISGTSLDDSEKPIAKLSSQPGTQCSHNTRGKAGLGPRANLAELLRNLYDQFPIRFCLIFLKTNFGSCGVRLQSRFKALYLGAEAGNCLLGSRPVLCLGQSWL